MHMIQNPGGSDGPQGLESFQGAPSPLRAPTYRAYMPKYIEIELIFALIYPYKQAFVIQDDLATSRM